MTPTAKTRALYESIGTLELLELRAAFEADYAQSPTEMGMQFCRGRLALIADVLLGRVDDAARKADA